MNTQDETLAKTLSKRGETYPLNTQGNLSAERAGQRTRKDDLEAQ